MTAVRAQVILKTDDNNPENFVTNSLAFDYTVSAANLDATTAALKTFYDSLNAGVLGDAIAQNGHLVKYYVLPGVKPNYPQDEQVFNMAANPASPGFPSEVALCLSFQGSRVSGQPQARKQGRIYIGTIRTAAATGGRPSTAAMTVLANAATAFRTEIDTNTDGFWGVWSVANQTIEEVTDGWVDDAWDTQRRRGLARTTRTTWT